MKKKLFAKYGTAFVLLLMLLFIGNTMAFGYTAWEDDRFDGFQLGSLNGKNGWTGTINAQLVTDDRYDNPWFKVLYVNPAPGQIITNSKTITSQSLGYHYMDLLVRVDNVDPLQPTLAKLAVHTTYTGNPWGRKFQLYFGANIRVNYDSAGNDIMLVETTETGRWYWVRVELYLAENLIYVFCDGQYKGSATMGSGAITGLVLTGWDRPGEVYLDDIYGLRRS